MVTPDQLEHAYQKGLNAMGGFGEPPKLEPAQEYAIKGGYLSMSDALKCDRLNTYKYLGVQPSNQRSQNGSAEAGIYLEGKIVEALELGGVTITSRGDRCRVSIHGIAHSGRLDGAVNSRQQILEIKTIDESGFEKNLQFNQPSPWNRPQVELYLRSTLKPMALIIYVNRNDPTGVRVYELTRDDDLWERIKSSVHRVAAAQSPKDVPRERIPLCKWCVYRDTCWDELPE